MARQQQRAFASLGGPLPLQPPRCRPAGGVRVHATCSGLHATRSEAHQLGLYLSVCSSSLLWLGLLLILPWLIVPGNPREFLRPHSSVPLTCPGCCLLMLPQARVFSAPSPSSTAAHAGKPLHVALELQPLEVPHRYSDYRVRLVISPLPWLLCRSSGIRCTNSLTYGVLSLAWPVAHCMRWPWPWGARGARPSSSGGDVFRSSHPLLSLFSWRHPGLATDTGIPNAASIMVACAALRYAQGLAFCLGALPHPAPRRVCCVCCVCCV